MKIVYGVCTLDYLPQADVMFASFLKYNPTYEAKLFVVDNTNQDFSSLPISEFLELIRVDDTIVKGYQDFVKRCNGFEISCVLKSFLAYYLINQLACDKVIYLDTDIYVLGSFEVVEQLLTNHNIILTPHTLGAFPNDNKTPSERTFFFSGLYNAGFFALSAGEDTQEFLNWWMSYMSKFCYLSKKQREPIVDQIWLNMAPIYWGGTHILRDKGYNVAYWNLHERTIQKSEEKECFWVSETEKLIFYHFSGFNTNHPTKLSKFQDRFDLVDLPDLQALCNTYTCKIESAKIHFSKNSKSKSRFRLPKWMRINN